jgi:hypothetical protein
LEFGCDILRLQRHAGLRPDFGTLCRAFPRFEQRKQDGTIWRNHRDPAVLGIHWGVSYKPETELLDIKLEAFILIADVHDDAVDAKVRLQLTLIAFDTPRQLIALEPFLRRDKCRILSHGSDYIVGQSS